MEIWKDILGYEERYQISTLGRIKSLARKTKTKIVEEKILTLKPNPKTGYIQIKLCKESKYKYPIVSRLVGEAFLKKPSYKCVINHKNHIRDDNRVENLEWISQSENIRYAYLQGRINQKGSKNNRAKISEEFVIEIRAFYKQNLHLSQREIAEKFNLKREHIKDIITQKTWKHI